jgi:hypothetical protein
MTAHLIDRKSIICPLYSVEFDASNDLMWFPIMLSPHFIIITREVAVEERYMAQCLEISTTLLPACCSSQTLLIGCLTTLCLLQRSFILDL